METQEMRIEKDMFGTETVKCRVRVRGYLYEMTGYKLKGNNRPRAFLKEVKTGFDLMGGQFPVAWSWCQILDDMVKQELMA